MLFNCVCECLYHLSGGFERVYRREENDLVYSQNTHYIHSIFPTTINNAHIQTKTFKERKGMDTSDWEFWRAKNIKVGGTKWVFLSKIKLNLN